MDKIKEVLKPKDVKPSLLKRLEANYGPVDIANDFFSTDLDTYFKTTNIDKETGKLTHTIINLASFGDSLKKMSDAVKALKVLLCIETNFGAHNLHLTDRWAYVFSGPAPFPPSSTQRR